MEVPLKDDEAAPLAHFEVETECQTEELAQLEGNARRKYPQSVQVALLACVVGAWNTAPLMIQFPGVTGVFGYVGAVMFTLMVQGLASIGTMNVVNHYYFYRSIGAPIRSFPDLGMRLGGPRLKTAFKVLQTISQVAFLPALIAIIAHSLQSLLWRYEWVQCNASAGALSVGVAIVLAFAAREWAHFEWLFALSFVLTFALVCILCYMCTKYSFNFGGPTQAMIGMPFEVYPECNSLAAVVSNESASSPDETETVGNATEAQSFYKFTSGCMSAEGLYSLNNVMQSLTILVFSYTPTVFIVELLNHLDGHGKISRPAAITGIEIGFWFSTCSCLLVGLFLAIRWGNQVPDLASLGMESSSWENMVINSILFIVACNLMVVDLLVLNSILLERAMYTWPPLARVGTRIVVVVIPCIAAFMFALFVPNFVTFISLLNGFGLIWVQFTLPSIFTQPVVIKHLYGRKADGALLLEAYPLSPILEHILAIIGVISFFFALLEIASFAFTVGSVSFEGRYWCKLVLPS